MKQWNMCFINNDSGECDKIFEFDICIKYIEKWMLP